MRSVSAGGTVLHKETSPSPAMKEYEAPVSLQMGFLYQYGCPAPLNSMTRWLKNALLFNLPQHPEHHRQTHLPINAFSLTNHALTAAPATSPTSSANAALVLAP